MFASPTIPYVIDNQAHKLADVLNSIMAAHPNASLDIATAYFTLTGKSKVQNYLGDYQKSEGELSYDALMDVLFKNKGRLGVSLSDARFTHRLQEEYERSLGVLRPIKAQLTLTDSLIDQVVYRLYGLTEEEIGIVQGVQSSEETH